MHIEEALVLLKKFNLLSGKIFQRLNSDEFVEVHNDIS
jgi:hypothetical protein